MTLRAETERTADASDRATAEEQACTDEALRLQLARIAREAGPPPEPDGQCACGCGAEVDPRRSALGYGLALGCQERRELAARTRARH